MEMKIFLRDRNGVFFSADALIALIIILIVLLVAYPLSNYVQPDSDIHSDILSSLSTLTVRDINSTLSQSYDITDYDQTLLEQMSELYVLHPNSGQAENFLEEILKDLNTTENVGIWFGNDTLIYSKNSTPYESAREIDVVKQTVSGLQAGENITGFAARAFLSSDSRSKYFYFGGYVGDGNISAQIAYPGNISGNATIEAVVDKDFELWVNGLKLGTYSGSLSTYGSVLRPVRHEFSTSSFHTGINTVELRGNSLYIAGGFIKINYRGEADTDIGRYNFPGINGLINLYDGVYAPKGLTSMNIHLNFSSNYTTFLNIGNVTVYNSTGGGAQAVNVLDSYLSTVLDYSSMEGKTIPLRLGLENASLVGITKPIDVFSVTDVSGSMENGDFCYDYSWSCCPFGWGCSSVSSCESCGGTWVYDRLPLAKEANNAFIDFMLNSTSNRVGLVAYSDVLTSSYAHVLSNNSASLKSKVSSWSAGGGTCICCGIINATQRLDQTSNSSKFRSMVVMSDGDANVICPSQGSVPDMDGAGGANTPADHAIYSAQRACQRHGIVIHSVGFEVGASGRATLEKIAQAGCNGTYYSSSAEDLVEVYQQVANSILTEYAEQTLVASEGGIITQLYPDSYIDFGYGETVNSKGLVITIEKDFDNSNGGTFYIPANAQPVITHVVSYSGPKWTSKAIINNKTLFDLNAYSSPYIKLGDPYHITFSDAVVLSNSTNTVNISTGVSSGNQSSGSQYNKIIYTIVKNSTAYSGIKAIASGCNWYIQFEDNSYGSFKVPSNYTGSDTCSYTNASISTNGTIDNENDAYQLAVKDLLGELDLDLDGKIDVLLSGSDLDISLSRISGLPFDYATVVEVRRWV